MKTIFKVLIVIGILILIGVLANLNAPKDIQKIKKLKPLDDYSNISEFHYIRMPITYSIEVHKEPVEVSLLGYFNSTWYMSGYNEAIKRINSSLKILENKTEGRLKFKEVDLNESANIKFILLSDWEFSQLGLTENYDAIGLAKHINIDESRIYEYEIYIIALPQSYKRTYSFFVGTCQNFPSTELHEILHALGFDHINDTSSIMYPIQDENPCHILSVDEKIISCLDYIYSNGEIEGNCSGLTYLNSLECPEGTYEAINNIYACCEKPNMIIDEYGYCS